MALESIGPKLHIQSTARPVSSNACNLTINALAIAILIACIGLCCHYGLNPSLGKMIKILPNFSISVELIVASGTGILMVGTLAIQLYRKKWLAPFVGTMVAIFPSLQQRVREELHPFADREKKNDCSYPVSHSEATKVLSRPSDVDGQDRIEATFVRFYTRDHAYLPAYWHFQGTDRPTVILFHEQSSAAACMAAPWGKYYLSMGFNVLLAEFRGYGMSHDDVSLAATANQELEAYLDAEAALRFALNQGVDSKKIIAHGSSLGGAYASALGYFFDIDTVILDHSFTTPQAAASKVSKVVSEQVCKEAIMHAYLQGTIDADAEIGKKPLMTDGFDSLQKMTDAKNTDLFVIQGKDDPITPEYFGHQFMESKYSDSQLHEKRLALVEGGHSKWHFFKECPTAKQAQAKLKAFFVEKNFIDESVNCNFTYTETDLRNNPYGNAHRERWFTLL